MKVGDRVRIDLSRSGLLPTDNIFKKWHAAEGCIKRVNTHSTYGYYVGNISFSQAELTLINATLFDDFADFWLSSVLNKLKQPLKGLVLHG